MAVPSSPLRHVAYSDPLDDEWEKLQTSGCPDWWLLAKYVGQAARSFPYQPFRGMSVAGSGPQASSGGEGSVLEVGERDQRSMSKEMQVVTGSKEQVCIPAVHTTTAASTSSGWSKGRADARDGLLQRQAPVAAAAALPDRASSAAGSMADAMPTAPCYAAGAGSSPAPTSTCGLKGIFGCNGGCGPSCTAGRVVDQQMDQKG